MAIARPTPPLGDLAAGGVVGGLIAIHIVLAHILPVFGLPEGSDSWIIAASARTTDPFAITSYFTAAVSHSSWAHLGRNVGLLLVPLWFLQRVLGLRRTVGVFAVAAVTAVIVYVFLGYTTGYNGFVRGASGGSYALLTLAGLVTYRVDRSIRHHSISIPVYFTPMVLLGLEMLRLTAGFPLPASPYAHVGHMAGVIVGVFAWWLLGRPTASNR